MELCGRTADEALPLMSDALEVNAITADELVAVLLAHHTITAVQKILELPDCSATG